jgi:hypothetical protein
LDGDAAEADGGDLEAGFAEGDVSHHGLTLWAFCACFRKRKHGTRLCSK